MRLPCRAPLLFDGSYISFESLLLILNGYVEFWHDTECRIGYSYGRIAIQLADLCISINEVLLIIYSQTVSFIAVAQARRARREASLVSRQIQGLYFPHYKAAWSPRSIRTLALASPTESAIGRQANVRTGPLLRCGGARLIALRLPIVMCSAWHVQGLYSNVYHSRFSHVWHLLKSTCRTNEEISHRYGNMFVTNLFIQISL